MSCSTSSSSAGVAPHTQTSLMVNPSEIARSVAFSEQAVHVFGKTAMTRGRLHLYLNDRRVDHRFLRVLTSRNWDLAGRLASRLRPWWSCNPKRNAPRRKASWERCCLISPAVYRLGAFTYITHSLKETPPGEV
jgi:hypothetical protein